MREEKSQTGEEQLPLSGWSVMKILDELFSEYPGGTREIDAWRAADAFVKKVESGKRRLKNKHEEERFKDIKYFVEYLREDAEKFKEEGNT